MGINTAPIIAPESIIRTDTFVKWIVGELEECHDSQVILLNGVSDENAICLGLEEVVHVR